MMTAEQLKVSLYLLLFSGKLTEQLADDGTTKELLKRIEKKHPASKKAVRIIKNESGDYYEVAGPKETCITDELLFDIPDNWAWVHLNEIAISGLGKTLNKSKDTGDIKQYLCSINVYWDGIHLDEIKEAKFSESDIEKYKLMKGDLLICEGGDAGRTAIWEYENEMYYQNALHRVRFWEGIDPYYFRALMEFYKLNGTIDSYCKGMTIKHLVQGSLNAMRFPLPPIAEQKRIVAKIEELMPFVEQYAAASTKLNTLNVTFPEMMKKSILQEAVQGKLVPQDPNDEPASLLLKKIAEEKKKLIKEGKIKKQKPLPEITEDEIPFDIPDSWEWVRLGSILKLLTDGTHKTPHYVTEGVPFISVKDMSSGCISFSNTKFITEKEADELNMRCNPERGDVLLSKVGTTGVPAPVDTDIKFSLFVSVALLKFNIDLINRDYLINVINSPCVQKQCAENTRGVGNKNWVMRDIANTLIPIAPLREQERIVSELKRIIPQFSVLEQKMER